MAQTVSINKTEFPETMATLYKAYGIYKLNTKKKNGRKSFRAFAADTLLNACDNLIAQAKSKSQEDNLGNVDKKIEEAVNG